jgi:hypothetical protein
VGLTSRLARAEAGVGGQRLTSSYIYDGLFSQVESITSLLVGLTSGVDGLFNQVESITSLLVGLTNQLARESRKLDLSSKDRG